MKRYSVIRHIYICWVNFFRYKVYMKLLKNHIILLDRIGVYEIFCLKTGKNYVGSTSVSFKKRLEKHNKHLKNNKHINIHLQRAYNKYKDKNFEMRILEVCSKKEIIEREQFWIDTFQATKYGYNICPIANSSIGVKRSPETREKIRKAKLGKSPVLSEEERQNRKERQKLMMTPEARKKAVEKRKSRKLTMAEKKSIKKLILKAKSKIYTLEEKELCRQRFAKARNIVLFTGEQVKEIKRLYKEDKLTIKKISEKFNTNYRNIYNIIKGKTYR